MDCTHPVLYNHPDGLRCHICGALIADKPATDQPEGREEKPVETPKRKRKAKGADGNENH